MLGNPLPLTDAAWARIGAGQAFGIPSLALAASMLAVGGLAHDVGFPIFATLLSTIFIWAAPAQVILFGLVATGASAPVIAIAISFSSVRFLPMCLSILPLIRREGTRTFVMIFAAHLVAVTNWVEGMRRLPGIPAQGRLPFFFGFGLVVMASATVATAVGFYLASNLPPLAAAALLFVSPIYFISALTRAVRVAADIIAIVLAMALTPVGLWLLPTGFDLIAVGLTAGTIAYAVGRQQRNRRRARAPIEDFGA